VKICSRMETWYEPFLRSSVASRFRPRLGPEGVEVSAWRLQNAEEACMSAVCRNGVAATGPSSESPDSFPDNATGQNRPKVVQGLLPRQFRSEGDCRSSTLRLSTVATASC
jgi:hypothetical protein